MMLNSQLRTSANVASALPIRMGKMSRVRMANSSFHLFRIYIFMFIFAGAFASIKDRRVELAGYMKTEGLERV